MGTFSSDMRVPDVTTVATKARWTGLGLFPRGKPFTAVHTLLAELARPSHLRG